MNMMGDNGNTAWQPLTWVIFHILALKYDSNETEHYIRFFNTFKTIIPCKICRNHFQEKINSEGMSIEKNIKDGNIFQWTILLHNNVNKMNGKREWTFDQARQFYEKPMQLNALLKSFLLEYVKTNFKRNPEKTNALLEMMRELPYLHPNIEKRKKLVEFTSRFPLRRDTLKNWLTAFLLLMGAPTPSAGAMGVRRTPM